jgi:hypothetical protein
MKPRDILTILEIAGHPEFHGCTENSFKLAGNRDSNRRATLEQVRHGFRCVSHLLRKLD